MFILFSLIADVIVFIVLAVAVIGFIDKILRSIRN